MKPLRLTRILLQICALAVFTYQMVQAVARYTSFSSIASLGTRVITDATLPDIYVCQEGQNVSAVLNEHLYDFGMEDFLAGQIFGYSGLTWNGYKNVSYESILSQMQPERETFLVEGKPRENWKNFSNMKQVFTAFNGFCTKIRVNTTGIPPDDLFVVSFYAKNDKSVQVIVADTGSAPYYMINTDTLAGDAVAFEQGFAKYYTINFEEMVWREENLECTNYGQGSAYQSYAECVSSEQQPYLGCKVPWLSAPDDPSICKGLISPGYEMKNTFETFRQQLWDKVKMSDLVSHTSACRRPCLELRAQARLKTREKSEPNWSVVFLNFQKTVKVTMNKKAYGIFDLLVEIGSSLGLWVGLSALGLFDFLLQAAELCKANLANLEFN